jgi:HK97 family phage portal protein
MSIFDRIVNRKAVKTEAERNELFKMLLGNISFGTPLIDIKSQGDAISKGYMYNHIVYTIVNRIINSIAGIPFSVYRLTDEKKAVKALEAFRHKDFQAAMYYKSTAYELDINNPLNELLKNPNEAESFNDIIMGLGAFYLITGNGYLYGLRQQTGDRQIIRLHVMPSHKVEIVFGSYLKPVKGYKLDTFIDGEINASDVLHIKNFNPKYDTYGSWLYGLSPIQASAQLITLSNYTYSTQTDNMSNYGVRGLLSGKDNTLTTQQAKDIKEKWDSVKTKSKGDIMVVGAPLDWVNIGLSSVDLQIIEQQKLTLRDLCMIYNTPSQLFGDSEHSTYSNMREARKAMITDASIPLLEKIKDGLNRFLGMQGLLIDYDMQSFTELQDDLQQQVTALSQAWWLTGNEKRLTMGRMAYEDEMMDTVLVPAGLIPINELSYNEYDGNEGLDDEMA